MDNNIKKDIIIIIIVFQVSLVLCILKLLSYIQISWFIVVYPFIGFIIICVIDYVFLIGIAAFLKYFLKIIIKIKKYIRE